MAVLPAATTRLLAVVVVQRQRHEDLGGPLDGEKELHALARFPKAARSIIFGRPMTRDAALVPGARMSRIVNCAEQSAYVPAPERERERKRGMKADPSEEETHRFDTRQGEGALQGFKFDQKVFEVHPEDTALFRKAFGRVKVEHRLETGRPSAIAVGIRSTPSTGTWRRNTS